MGRLIAENRYRQLAGALILGGLIALYYELESLAIVMLLFGGVALVDAFRHWREQR